MIDTEQHVLPMSLHKKFVACKDRHELAKAMNEALDNICYWSDDEAYWSTRLALIYKEITGYIFVRTEVEDKECLTKPF